MENNLKVELLYYTPEPESAVAMAARVCYSKNAPSGIYKKMSKDQKGHILQTILQNGHSSTLEHASYTFSIEGISRACSHQLVRHRLASYNQQSQRYVKADSDLNIIIPKSIKNNNVALKEFNNIIHNCELAYQELLKLDIPAEDARYILPNATETKIVVTMNIRELLNFFNLRCCNRAQWEIRELANKMLNLVKPTAPMIFKDAGPDCVKDKCHEGKMSCGNPYKHNIKGE